MSGKYLCDIDYKYYFPNMEENIARNGDEHYSNYEAFTKIIENSYKYKIKEIYSKLTMDLCIKIINLNHFIVFEYKDEDGDEQEDEIEFYGSTKLDGLERCAIDAECYISRNRIDYKKYFENMFKILNEKIKFKYPFFGECKDCKCPQFINEDKLCEKHQKKDEEETFKGYVYIVEDENELRIFAK
jgi:hypothetical protein